MAKLLPGPGATEPRGQIGGVVFSRNRFGLYMRSNTSPVNPMSPRQTTIRSIFTQMAQRWRDTVTPTQRARWESYAQGTPLPDQYGLKQTMLGLNMYQRFNVPWVDIGETVVDDAPTAAGQAPMLTVTLIGNSVEGIKATAIVPTLTTNDRIVILRCAAAVSRARNFFNGPWTFNSSFAGDVVLPAVVVDPAEVAVGQRWYFQFRALVSDGKAGPTSTFFIDINT
jgi:hypothetical protein